MTESIAQQFARLLPQATGEVTKFKSSTAIPAGINVKMCAWSINRIVSNPGNTRAYEQAMATLLQPEVDFVSAVVREYRDWQANEKKQ